MNNLIEHLRWKGHQQGDSQLLEAANELERVMSLPSLDEAEASCEIMRFIASVARGNPIDPKAATEAVSRWVTYCGRQRAVIQRQRAEISFLTRAIQKHDVECPPECWPMEETLIKLRQSEYKS